MAPTTKTSPRDGAAGGDAEGGEEEEGARGEHRAVAHAELAPVGTGAASEERLEPVVAPAAQADAEALEGHPRQAAEAGDEDGRGEGGVGLAPAPGEERQGEEDGEGDEPELLPLRDEGERRGAVLVDGPAVEDPGEGPEAVVDGVPRQDGEADPADHHPEDDGRVERPGFAAPCDRHALTAAASRPRRPSA